MPSSPWRPISGAVMRRMSARSGRAARAAQAFNAACLPFTVIGGRSRYSMVSFVRRCVRSPTTMVPAGTVCCNRAAVVTAEAASFIFACKKDGPDGVWIRGLKQGLPLAALPATATLEVLDRVRPAFPEFAPAVNVLDTSLNNVNNPLHPPAALLNVGRIEKFGGDWSFFHEGMTPAVCRLMERLDEERLAVVGALGLPEVSLLEWNIKFYGHQGLGGKTLYEAMSTTPVHGAARAPSSLDHRYFTEDVPFGLVPTASLGRALGIPTPVTDGVVAVSSAVCGRDFVRLGRTVETLGLGGMNAKQILAYVEAGAARPAVP